MSLLPTMLDHLAWADARARAAVRALDAHAPDSRERAQARRLYAHLAAAEHVWLARLEGRTPAHPVWPDLAPDAAEALADALEAGEAFTIQVANERLRIPADAEFTVEHERADGTDELEFQVRWPTPAA